MIFLIVIKILEGLNRNAMADLFAPTQPNALAAYCRLLRKLHNCNKLLPKPSEKFLKFIELNKNEFFLVGMSASS